MNVSMIKKECVELTGDRMKKENNSNSLDNGAHKCTHLHFIEYFSTEVSLKSWFDTD